MYTARKCRVSDMIRRTMTLSLIPRHRSLLTPNAALIGFVCCVRCPATLQRATTQCILTSPIYICQERKFRGRLVCLGVRPCDCSSLAK